MPSKNRLIYTPVSKENGSREFGIFFEGAERQFCPAGMILLTPEVSEDKLYRLIEGRAHLYRVTPNGKRLVTREVIAGTVFGFVGLLGQIAQGNYAETIEDSIVSVVTRDHVIEVLRQRPEIALRMLGAMANRVLTLEQQLVAASYSPVSVRLSNFILANSDSVSGIVANFTHEEIADVIGAARQTVTESLHLLKGRGFIVIEPMKIQIIDRQGLNRFAGTQS